MRDERPCHFIHALELILLALSVTALLAAPASAESAPPVVTGSSPLDFSSVTTVDRISVTFDREMDEATSASARVSPGSIVTPALLSGGRILDFRIAPLTVETTYIVTISSESARDLEGTSLDGDRDGIPGGDFVLQFTLTAWLPGKLEVNVKDDAGRSTSGAEVTLLREGRKIITQQTDAVGQFVFGGLSAGSYSINAQKPGFEGSSGLITVNSGETTKVDLALARVAVGKGTDAVLLGGGAIGVGLAGGFAFLHVRRPCPRCRAKRPLGKKVCRSCGYPKSLPRFFTGNLVVKVATPQTGSFFREPSAVKAKKPKPSTEGKSAAPGSRIAPPSAKGQSRPANLNPKRTGPVRKK